MADCIPITTPLNSTDGEDQPLIHSILPRMVAVAESNGDADPGQLLPEEAAIVSTAVMRRRREFAASRACARRALVDLGVEPTRILSGPHREPIWPPGVVGSITHCEGYCAAAVSYGATLAGLGIDAEIHAPLPAGVAEKIAYGEEREWLRTRRYAATCWDRLLFSAKESVFKVWFPLTAHWLEFRDVLVTFRPDTNRFDARLLVAHPIVDGRRVSTLEGRFLLGGGLVLTAVVLERVR
jgi:4'-phosphopantetheinyl transferase EntD